MIESMVALYVIIESLQSSQALEFLEIVDSCDMEFHESDLTHQSMEAVSQ